MAHSMTFFEAKIGFTDERSSEKPEPFAFKFGRIKLMDEMRIAT